MPVPFLPEVEVKQILALVKHDLKMILDENEVSILIQAAWVNVGFTSLQKFQKVGGADGSVDKVCKLLGLKEDELTDLADMGSVQAAYIAAKTGLIAANQMKAEKQLL